MKNKYSSLSSGFTLVEILIVVMIVVVIAVVALFVFNPTKQRHKVWDIQRKRELEQLRILFENYFMEHNEYPNDQQVCYDTAEVDENGYCSCHICGLERDVGTFASLVRLLYCDPEHGRKDYLYKYDCSQSGSQWYVMYGQLSSGPGAEQSLTCNYAVTNDQTKVEANPAGCLVEGNGQEPPPGASPTPLPGSPSNTPAPGDPGGSEPSPTPPACPDDNIPKYCRLGGICNICGNYANCLQVSTCDQPPALFSDSQCNNACQNFGGFGPSSTPIPTPTTFQLGSCPLDPAPKYCRNAGSCNNCGSFQQCLDSNACDNPLVLYGNDTCNGICYE